MPTKKNAKGVHRCPGRVQAPHWCPSSLSAQPLFYTKAVAMWHVSPTNGSKVCSQMVAVCLDTEQEAQQHKSHVVTSGQSPHGKDTERKLKAPLAPEASWSGWAFVA